MSTTQVLNLSAGKKELFATSLRVNDIVIDSGSSDAAGTASTSTQLGLVWSSASGIVAATPVWSLGNLLAEQTSQPAAQPVSKISIQPQMGIYAAGPPAVWTNTRQTLWWCGFEGAKAAGAAGSPLYGVYATSVPAQAGITAGNSAHLGLTTKNASSGVATGQTYYWSLAPGGKSMSLQTENDTGVVAPAVAAPLVISQVAPDAGGVAPYVLADYIESKYIRSQFLNPQQCGTDQIISAGGAAGQSNPIPCPGLTNLSVVVCSFGADPSAGQWNYLWADTTTAPDVLVLKATKVAPGPGSIFVDWFVVQYTPNPY